MNRLLNAFAIFSPAPAMIAIFCLLCPYQAFPSAMTKDSIERYFSDLKKDFDKISENPAIQKQKSKQVNGLFVTTLKKHQPLYSLIRTNAKGVIVNTVVRGQVPEKVKKNIKDQSWFKRISKTSTEYDGFTFIEENGRYYLFWVCPVLSPKKRFAGAVVAKIDLWDCFHEMSRETSEPFLIRLGGRSLYSDKWKNGKNVLEVPFEVPGVEKFTLITEKPVIAPDTMLASTHRDTGAVAAVSPTLLSTKAEKPKGENGFFAKNKVLIVIIGIVALIIVVFLLIQFYSWLSHVFTMREINKADDDPFGRR